VQVRLPFATLHLGLNVSFAGNGKQRE